MAEELATKLTELQNLMVNNMDEIIPPIAPEHEETQDETMERITDGLFNLIGRMMGPVDHNLLDEARKKAFSQIYFKDCLKTMTMNEAIRATKEKYDLPDDYEIELTIKVKMSDIND